MGTTTKKQGAAWGGRGRKLSGGAPAPAHKTFGTGSAYAPYAKSNPKVGGKK